MFWKWPFLIILNIFKTWFLHSAAFSQYINIILTVDYWEEELGIEEPGDMTTLYPGEPGEPGDMTTLYPGEGSDDLEKMYSTPELELDRYIKGTVSVITSGPQCKDGNTRFTTAH